MSLLLKALKQAEEQKRLREAAAQELDAPLPELTLDAEPPSGVVPSEEQAELEFVNDSAEMAAEDAPTPVPFPVDMQMALQDDNLAEEVDQASVARRGAATQEVPLQVPPVEEGEPASNGQDVSSSAVGAGTAARFDKPQATPSAHSLHVASTILNSTHPRSKDSRALPWLMTAGGGSLLVCLGWLYWQWQGIPGVNPLVAPTAVSVVTASPAASNVQEHEKNPYKASQDGGLAADDMVGYEAPVLQGNKERAGVKHPDLPVQTTERNEIRPAVSNRNGSPKFERHLSDDREDAGLLAAWQAYQDGRMEQAKAGYEKVLQQDTRNRDAMLGMGAVSLRQGLAADAAQWYRRVLQAYPQDETARAALLAIGSQEMDAATAARLQQESRPENALLLGQYYAAQQRWAEAQEQYFTAWSQSPDNPGLAFNLAVCLDHLNQPRLAMEYYQKALKLSQGKKGQSFDPASVQRRVSELEASLR